MTPKEILIKVLNEWDNPNDLDLTSILAKRSLPFMEKAMREYAKQEAIEFAKWMADLEASEEQSGHIYGLTLIDGNYYWEGDEDGDQPLNEEQLYKMFSEENKTHKI